MVDVPRKANTSRRIYAGGLRTALNVPLKTAGVKPATRRNCAIECCVLQMSLHTALPQTITLQAALHRPASALEATGVDQLRSRGTWSPCRK